MDSNYMSTRFNLSGNRKELGQQIYVAKANLYQFLPVAWEDAMAALEQTGGTEGTAIASTGTWAGGAVGWGGVGVAMSCVS